MNKVVFIDCDQMHLDSIVIIHVARGIPLAIGKIILWTGSFGDILDDEMLFSFYILSILFSWSTQFPHKIKEDNVRGFLQIQLLKNLQHVFCYFRTLMTN
jgi:hypothetical protein